MERKGGKQGETRVSAQFLGSSTNTVPGLSLPVGKNHGAEKESSSDMKDAVLSSVVLPV